MFSGFFCSPFLERNTGNKSTRKTRGLLWHQAEKHKHGLRGLTGTGTSSIFYPCGWETHTHLHTLSVHSPEFHRLCCTSYSPLSSPSACAQIRDSSVRRSDIQVPVCLPLPHSSPKPAGPGQLQNGAGPPKNSISEPRGFHFTGHTESPDTGPF